MLGVDSRREGGEQGIEKKKSDFPFLIALTGLGFVSGGSHGSSQGHFHGIRRRC